MNQVVVAVGSGSEELSLFLEEVAVLGSQFAAHCKLVCCRTRSPQVYVYRCLEFKFMSCTRRRRNSGRESPMLPSQRVQQEFEMMCHAVAW